MNNDNKASQPKVESIGDDAQFMALLNEANYTASEASVCGNDFGTGDKAQAAEDALIAYLDSKLRAPVDQAASLAPVQLAAIQGLIAVASAAYHLMDSTEESGPVGDSVFTHQGDDHEYLSEALNQLDALPDDQPGYVMGPCAKAEWALRGILAAQSADKPAVDLSALPVYYMEGLENGGYYLRTDVNRALAVSASAADGSERA